MFRDRVDAGRELARRLAELPLDRPVVLGLPRGGVPVAAEVARALGAPCDVLVVRKLGVPWHPELGMGAIGEGDVRVLNQELVAQLDLSAHELEDVAARERAELDRRVRRYRGERAPVDVRDRTVVIVDDGIATGFTARAAVEVVRARGATRVILAAPVAPCDAVAELARVADEVVCVEAPRAFWAIGEFYDDFTQISATSSSEIWVKSS